jgi:hypothetical protein
MIISLQAPLSRPQSSNPISLDAPDSSAWLTETQRATNEAIQTHSTEDYLIAGVTTTSSIDGSPHNFAWPVPEAPRPPLRYKKNIHTEYRDNYHEWATANDNTHVSARITSLLPVSHVSLVLSISVSLSRSDH